MIKNNLNYEEIRDLHLDNILRLAYMQADALEAQSIMEEAEQSGFDDESVHMEDAYDLFLRKLAIQEKKDKREERIIQLRRFAPRIIQVAACLILFMGIATPIAVANVESIRVKVLELLISIQNDHTDLELIENPDESFYVPVEWQGAYYPTYVPNGFALTEIGENYNYLIFEDIDENRIEFYEYDENDYTAMNTEDAVLTYEMVNGESAIIAEDQRTYIAWGHENKYFMITGDISKGEILEIARGVRRIIS